MRSGRFSALSAGRKRECPSKNTYHAGTSRQDDRTGGVAVSTAKPGSMQNGRSREPSPTCIKVLVVLVALGVMPAVFVPKIVGRQREAAVARALAEIWTASPARAKELITAFQELVNTRHQGGRSALHHAAGKGRKDVAELLLANGADVNAKDQNGSTPLAWAAFEGHKDVAELLLAKGADVNVMIEEGITPLEYAAAQGRKDLAEVLLAYGARVNVKSRMGSTPLHWAAGRGYRDVAELLLANGADVNSKDWRGRTPLAVAEERGHTELVELLKKHVAEESE